MARSVLREVSWFGQVAAFAIDAAIGFACVLGVFRLAFERTPNILTGYDFTMIVALNALLFALPALIMDGSTIGARVLGYRITKGGQAPIGWISLVRGLYFFPFGVIVTAFHLPLKMLMDDHAPFDPIFGLRLKQKKTISANVCTEAEERLSAKTTSGVIMYGSAKPSMDDARLELERALGIKFAVKDSAFWGEYYACKAYGGREMMLLPSGAFAQPDIGDPVSPETDNLRAVFHVYGGKSGGALIEELIAVTSFQRLG